MSVAAGADGAARDRLHYVVCALLGHDVPFPENAPPGWTWERMDEVFSNNLVRKEGPLPMHPNWHELKGYLENELGQAFHHEWMGGWDALVEREFMEFKTPKDFYKGGRQYLYHLTAFDLDIWKAPYRNAVVERVKPCTLLDYGCGIGTDGLWFEKRRFAANFADYDSECTKFLRWRLERRGMVDSVVYDIEDDKTEIPRHELVVSFDVLEHVPPPDQEAFLRRLAELGKTVAVNLRGKPLPPWNGRPALHYPVDVEGLTEVAKAIAGESGGGFWRGTFNVHFHLLLFDTPEPSEPSGLSKPSEPPEPSKAARKRGEAGPRESESPPVEEAPEKGLEV